MGQYYKPIILDEDGKIEFWLRCYDFDNGAKLMEHSWLGNEFVMAVEGLLAQEAPRRLVWAGDYADPEPDGRPLYDYVYDEDGNDLDEPYRPDLPSLGKKAEYHWHDSKTGRRLTQPKITYVKDPEVVPNAPAGVVVTRGSHPFILNWDKKEFVNKRRVPRLAYYWTSGRKQGVHPLPILTAEGNGRGGGDFNTDGYGDRSRPRGNFGLIGSWARDHISVNASRPEGAEWTEIHFDLVEMGVDETDDDKAANQGMRAFR